MSSPVLTAREIFDRHLSFKRGSGRPPRENNFVVQHVSMHFPALKKRFVPPEPPQVEEAYLWGPRNRLRREVFFRATQRDNPIVYILAHREDWWISSNSVSTHRGDERISPPSYTKLTGARSADST